MHRRLLLGATVAIALLALSAPAVSATPPSHDSWADEGDGVSTELCSFPVAIHWQASGDFTVYLNKDGSGKIVEQDAEQDTFSANGHTLVGDPYRYNGITKWDAAGIYTSVVTTGGVERVPLPDGSVFWSAGRVDYLAQSHDWTITPDNGHSGNVEAFCEALED